MLLFVPLFLGAAVTFIPRWTQGDTNAGALANILAGYARASAWFIARQRPAPS